MGKVVGLEDLLRQRQSLIEARSSEVEVVSLPSSRSISPTKTPVRLNERCGPLNHGVQCSWVYAAPLNQFCTVTGMGSPRLLWLTAWVASSEVWHVEQGTHSNPVMLSARPKHIMPRGSWGGTEAQLWLSRWLSDAQLPQQGSSHAQDQPLLASGRIGGHRIHRKVQNAADGLLRGLQDDAVALTIPARASRQVMTPYVGG